MDTKSQLSVYRNCTPVVDAWFRTEGEQTITDAVIGALAEAEGVDSTDIPPLYDAVDLDALSRLFQRESTDGDAVFGFTFENWNVFVRSDGRIRVCDADQASDLEPVFEGSTV